MTPVPTHTPRSRPVQECAPTPAWLSLASMTDEELVRRLMRAIDQPREDLESLQSEIDGIEMELGDACGRLDDCRAALRWLSKGVSR